MGLFSRRTPSDPAPDEAAAPPTAAETDVAEPAAPTVGISVSTYGGAGAMPGAPAAAASAPAAGDAPPTFRRGPAEAPPPTETLPGLRDNVLLAQALAALTQPATAPGLLNVARQLLQGQVFLRVKGDARALLAAGEPLALSVVERGGQQFVLVYSGGRPLQQSVTADGDTGTSAVGQSVIAVLRHVLAGSYEGIVLDNASAPARAVLPRPILERALGEADEQLRIKTLLSEPRTAATAAQVVDALIAAPAWVAVKRADDGSALGVAEARTATGERFLEVFSHPLEALALGRGDHALPVTTAQLATALARDAALTGVIVDPAGPWLRLTRDDLAPLLAHAE